MFKKCSGHIKVVFMVLALLLAFSVNSFALTPSSTTTKAERDAIANNWIYHERGYMDCNCLGYALGKTTEWVWPWGAAFPTLSQMSGYLNINLYSSTGNQEVADIYVYGSSSRVTHVAKYYGAFPLNGLIVAKWGQNEVFRHMTTSPYVGKLYGPKIATFSR